MIRPLSALILALSPTAVIAAPSEPIGARDFARQVIKYTLTEGDMSSERYLGYFTPRLRAAIVTDTKINLAANGAGSGARASRDFGLIDVEPICLCQLGDVKIVVRSISGDNKMATVRTEVRDGKKSSKVIWRLERNGRNWAISDLMEPEAGFPSLLVALERHNRSSRGVR